MSFIADGYDWTDVVLTASLVVATLLLLSKGNFVAGGVFMLAAVLSQGIASIRRELNRVSEA